MSTSTIKLFEEIFRKRSDLRWLCGFTVFGTLLAVPGLLAVTRNLNLDVDLGLAGLRFLAFNLGFLLAAALSSLVLNKFGVRPVAVTGLGLGAAGLLALALQPLTIPFVWELVFVAGTGVAAGSVCIASLFALKPFSSQLGMRALRRVTDLLSLGCLFSAVVGGVCYASGFGRLMPIPVAGAALLCLLLFITGRKPLVVIQKRGAKGDAKFRQLRTIAAFLLLCLLFVQLGSEWSVAAWLPLFLIHRLGSAPTAAISVLSLFFVALLAGRWLAGKLAQKLSIRTLAICGAVFALAGCVAMSVSISLPGILAGLIALAVGFAPPYLVLKGVLDETLQFAPAFYRVILSVAVSGAMGAAWLLGYVHQFLGMGALALFPAAGSVAVLVLELLLLFEAHLMGERTPARPHFTGTDRRTSP